MPKKTYLKNFQEVQERIINIGHWHDFRSFTPGLKWNKASNRNWRTLCIAHEEKNPSLLLWEEGSSFHCFGCGRNWNLISFFAEIKGISYFQSLIRLAKFYKIKLEWGKME